MFCYRITKYNPVQRSAAGSYERNDWTSFSDIGKTYEGEVLTYEKYKTIENAYINTIEAFMICSKTTAMHIKELEKHSSPIQSAFYTQEMLNMYDTVNNNMAVELPNINIIAQLALREDLWCKLESNNMYVHFGYDYYMYIGCAHPCHGAIEVATKAGLFVELQSSPYT